MSLEDRKYVVLDTVELEKWCAVCGGKGTMLTYYWYCEAHKWIGYKIYEKRQYQERIQA